MPNKSDAVEAMKQFLKRAKPGMSFKMAISANPNEDHSGIAFGGSTYPNLSGGIHVDADFLKENGVIRLTPRKGAIKSAVLKDLNQLLKLAGKGKLEFTVLETVPRDPGDDNDAYDEEPGFAGAVSSSQPYLSLAQILKRFSTWRGATEGQVLDDRVKKVQIQFAEAIKDRKNPDLVVATKALLALEKLFPAKGPSPLQAVSMAGDDAREGTGQDYADLPPPEVDPKVRSAQEGNLVFAENSLRALVESAKSNESLMKSGTLKGVIAEVRDLRAIVKQAHYVSDDVTARIEKVRNTIALIQQKVDQLAGPS